MTLEEITKRLDLLRSRFTTFCNLERRGSVIDPAIYEELQKNYEKGLRHLILLDAKEQYQEYKSFYDTWMNVNDPL